jgi:hypothetical protein
VPVATVPRREAGTGDRAVAISFVAALVVVAGAVVVVTRVVEAVVVTAAVVVVVPVVVAALEVVVAGAAVVVVAAGGLVGAVSPQAASNNIRSRIVAVKDTFLLSLNNFNSPTVCNRFTEGIDISPEDYKSII